MIEKRSLGFNASLNALKQGCAILFPVITFTYSNRILGKENVGIFSFNNSIVSYLLLLANLGISTYAVREGAKVRNERSKLNQFACEVFSINIVMMIVSYIILLILVLLWPRAANNVNLLLMQSISIILTVVGADWVNTIYEDYLYLTIRYIIIQVISLLVMVLFVKTKTDLLKYTLIYVLSNTGGNVFNILYIRKYINLKFVLKFDWVKHMRPMFIMFASSVASVIYLNSDITILGFLRENGEVGIYTVSSKIYQLAKTMVNALVLVTIPRFSYYISCGELNQYKKKYNSMANVIFAITLPVAVGLFVKAENIIYIIGGNEYLEGKTALQILCFAFFFAVGACIFSHSVLIPFSLERIYMCVTWVSAVINIILNFVLIPSVGINAAAMTTLLSEIIMFCITLIFANKKIHLKLNTINVTSVLLASFLVGLLCFIVNRLITDYILNLIISVFLSAVIYFIVLVTMKNPVGQSIIYIVNKYKQK